MRGTPLGPTRQGRAAIVDDGDIDRMLTRNYWLGKPLLNTFNRLRRLITCRSSESVYLAITLNAPRSDAQDG